MQPKPTKSNTPFTAHEVLGSNVNLHVVAAVYREEFREMGRNENVRGGFEQSELAG